MTVRYLFKVKLDLNKTIIAGFTEIHGVGIYFSRKIQAVLGILSSVKLNKLNNSDFTLVEHTVFDKVKRFELELFRFDYYNIQKLLNNASYRGLCHKLGRPVRGQRTHTNASTQFRLYRTRLKLRKW
jgi:ribosomal protein S13